MSCYCQWRLTNRLTSLKKLYLRHSRKDHILGRVTLFKIWEHVYYEYRFTWMQNSHLYQYSSAPELDLDSEQKTTLPKAKAKTTFSGTNTADKDIVVEIRAGQGKTAQPYPAEGQQQLFRLWNCFQQRFCLTFISRRLVAPIHSFCFRDCGS